MNTDFIQEKLYPFIHECTKSQDNNEKSGCEMLMIAHDVNCIFECNVGTSLCCYASGTFPNNWNLDRNHATGFIYDIGISKGQICL